METTNLFDYLTDEQIASYVRSLMTQDDIAVAEPMPEGELIIRQIFYPDSFSQEQPDPEPLR